MARRKQEKRRRRTRRLPKLVNGRVLKIKGDLCPACKKPRAICACIPLHDEQESVVRVSESVGVHFQIAADRAPKVGDPITLRIPNEEPVLLRVKVARKLKSGAVLVMSFIEKGKGYDKTLAKHKGEQGTIRL